MLMLGMECCGSVWRVLLSFCVRIGIWCCCVVVLQGIPGITIVRWARAAAARRGRHGWCTRRWLWVPSPLQQPQTITGSTQGRRAGLAWWASSLRATCPLALRANLWCTSWASPWSRFSISLILLKQLVVAFEYFCFNFATLSGMNTLILSGFCQSG